MNYISIIMFITVTIFTILCMQNRITGSRQNERFLTAPGTTRIEFSKIKTIFVWNL